MRSMRWTGRCPTSVAASTPRRWPWRSPRAWQRPYATPSPSAIGGGRRGDVFCHNYQLLVSSTAFLKFLFDFFPVILFFVAFKASDIYWATGVAIAATLLQIGYVVARGRKVTGMQWASLVIIGLLDRKSTRLNSSHSQISYAVFCLKKKKKK